MSKFQIGLLVAFSAFIVIAVILFSQNRGGGASIRLSVWGTLSNNDFNNILLNSGINKDQKISFTYTEKSSENIDNDFTEALAEGRGPDLIIISSESLINAKSKLLLIPNETVRPADFTSTFIKIGELFQTEAGTYALPMYVDPMVLYFNRELLTAASLAKPLSYWDEIYSHISKLTKKDSAGLITQSAIALGEARNIPNSKEVLSLLMLQAGTPIVVNTGVGLRSTLGDSGGLPQGPSAAALDFYTQFANSQKSFHTWSRILPSAQTHFTGGKSAMYLGFASELPTLRAKNPTLDLGLTQVPQSRASGKVITVGRVYGVAVSRGTRNFGEAVQGALTLIGSNVLKAMAETTPLVPARLDLLTTPPTDPAGFTFYSAALQARGWLDPDPLKTKKIWTDMIETVTSGRGRVEEAVREGSGALDALLNPNL